MKESKKKKYKKEGDSFSRNKRIVRYYLQKRFLYVYRKDASCEPLSPLLCNDCDGYNYFVCRRIIDVLKFMNLATDT